MHHNLWTVELGHFTSQHELPDCVGMVWGEDDFRAEQPDD